MYLVYDVFILGRSLLACIHFIFYLEISLDSVYFQLERDFKFLGEKTTVFYNLRHGIYMESTLVHLSGHQFATDPNPDHNPNRACNPYKYYTGVH